MSCIAVEFQSTKIYHCAYDLLLSWNHHISHILVEYSGVGFSEGSTEVWLNFHATLAVVSVLVSKKTKSKDD